jgi:Ni/Co efflux regulator RcnB
MRLILMLIAAVSLTTVGVARGDDDRGDKDRKEHFERREKRQRENNRRFEKQQHENRERYEEFVERQNRDARRGYRGGLPYRVYPGGPADYRHSGYRGYTPLAPYSAGVVPQPGGYASYLAQPATPSWNGQSGTLVDQLIGNAVAVFGSRQNGYGGNPPVNPGVVYGPGPVVPYEDDASAQPISPYPPAQYVTPYPGGDSPALGNYDAPLPPPDAQLPLNPAPTGGQITALADQLVGQANAFLQAFIPKIGIVPESQQFLADATALRDAAIRFREVANSGAPPAVLANEFRNVAAHWERLEARMARVSKGRIGPNIATALQMGGTIEQIRRLMP